jgi:hypothetical protein
MNQDAKSLGLAIEIVTERIDPRGKKRKTVVAAYCPFCGKKAS